MKKPLDIGKSQNFPAASALDISSDEGDGLYWIKPYFSTETEEVYVKFSSSGAFHLSEDAYSWSNAKAYCENRGSILASVHSQSEWEEILSIAKDVAHCGSDSQGDRCGGAASHETCMWFWLGGERKNGKWVWIDGSTWNWQPSTYTNSQPAQDSEDVCHSNYKNITRVAYSYRC